jgi:hypothetical protein
VTNGEVDSGEEDGTWRESGSEVQGPSRRAWCDDIRTRVLRVEYTDNVNYQCNAAYGERRGFSTLFCERDGVWLHIYTSKGGPRRDKLFMTSAEDMIGFRSLFKLSRHEYCSIRLFTKHCQ